MKRRIGRLEDPELGKKVDDAGYYIVEEHQDKVYRFKDQVGIQYNKKIYD